MRGYKVKITLNGSKPPIWRSCILPEGLALRELPDVFARVMGWRNSEHAKKFFVLYVIAMPL